MCPCMCPCVFPYMCPYMCPCMRSCVFPCMCPCMCPYRCFDMFLYVSSSLTARASVLLSTESVRHSLCPLCYSNMCSQLHYIYVLAHIMCVCLCVCVCGVCVCACVCPWFLLHVSSNSRFADSSTQRRASKCTRRQWTCTPHHAS